MYPDSKIKRKLVDFQISITTHNKHDASRVPKIRIIKVISNMHLAPRTLHPAPCTKKEPSYRLFFFSPKYRYYEKGFSPNGL